MLVLVHAVGSGRIDHHHGDIATCGGHLHRVLHLGAEVERAGDNDHVQLAGWMSQWTQAVAIFMAKSSGFSPASQTTRPRVVYLPATDRPDATIRAM